MTKRRWLNAALTAAETDTTALPWARGKRRARRKAAAKGRALAA